MNKSTIIAIVVASTLLASLVTTAVASRSAGAQSSTSTSTSTSSTGMHTPDWSTGDTIPAMAIDQFDPSDGTLLRAALTTSGTAETTFDRMANDSAFAGDMEGRTVTKFCFSLDQSACAASDVGIGAGSSEVVEFSSTVRTEFANMAISEVRSSAPVRETAVGEFVVPSALLAAFVGTGTTPVHCKTSAFTGATGPGTAGADWSTAVGCSVSVAYLFAAIDIEKTTNGVQADTAAESVPLTLGDAITWSYDVTNTGNTPLVDATVTDSMFGPVCTIDYLDPGVTRSCTMTGTAEDGQHRMEATVVGQPEGSPDVTVTDTDPTGYVVATPTATPVPVAATPVPTPPTPTTPPVVFDNPQIDIELDTNGTDADTGSGPTLASGDPIIWTYVVTNTGATDLDQVVVVDGVGATICTVGSLSIAQSRSCSVQGTASCDAVGRRDSAVTATSKAGVRVTDADPTHWNVRQCSGVVPATTPMPDAIADPTPEEVLNVVHTPTTQLAHTGESGDGAATVALVVSGLGLVALSVSEGLRRRHGDAGVA